MQFILTTATAVEKIKSRAKAIARTEQIHHTKALERVSKDAGYEGWYHVQQCLSARGKIAPAAILTNDHDQYSGTNKAAAYMSHLYGLKRSSITEATMKGDVFYDVTIEGIRFKGWIGANGPSIQVVSTVDPDIDSRFVQLGVASIRQCQMTEEDIGGEWWICKYSASERRINVDRLSTEGRNALAFEFGLPIIRREEDEPEHGLSKHTFFNGGEPQLFYLSPAFKSLCRWADQHPRKVRSYRNREQYLKLWVDAAISGKAPFDQP